MLPGFSGMTHRPMCIAGTICVTFGGHGSRKGAAKPRNPHHLDTIGGGSCLHNREKSLPWGFRVVIDLPWSGFVS